VYQNRNVTRSCYIVLLFLLFDSKSTGLPTIEICYNSLIVGFTPRSSTFTTETFFVINVGKKLTLNALQHEEKRYMKHMFIELKYFVWFTCGRSAHMHCTWANRRKTSLACRPSQISYGKHSIPKSYFESSCYLIFITRHVTYAQCKTPLHIPFVKIDINLTHETQCALFI